MKAKWWGGLLMVIMSAYGCSGGLAGPAVDGSSNATGAGTVTGTAPAVPGGVNLSLGDGRLTIACNSQDDAASFNAYCLAGSGVTKENATTEDTDITCPHTIAGLTNGTRYCCVVAAVNSSGETLSAETCSTPKINTHGTLDLSFNTDGILIINSLAGGNSHDMFDGVTVNSSGDIVAVGTSLDGSGTYDMAATVIGSSDGNVLTRFGSNGLFTRGGQEGSTDSGDDAAFSIATTASGASVLGGYTTNASINTDITVWQLTSAGVLDQSFGGGDGIFVLPNSQAAGGNGDDYANSCVVLSSGEIVCGGRSRSARGNTDAILIELSSSGTLERTSIRKGCDDGVDHGDDSWTSLVADANSCIVAVGFCTNASADSDIIVGRWCNGSFDSTFGGNGVDVYDSGAWDKGLGVALDADGNVVVSGFVTQGTGHAANRNMAVLRWLASSGTRDTSFGTNGLFAHDNAAGGNGDDEGSACTVDVYERIIVAGYSTGAGAALNDMVLWRLTKQGALDTTFANGRGFVIQAGHPDGTNNLNDGNSLVIDAVGRYVVCGDATNRSLNYDATCWRYE